MPTLHDVLYGSSRPEPPPPPEPTATGPAPLPDRARITPWCDPVVDTRGYDPRSTYVEQFWLSVLGPSAVWTMRMFAAGFDEHPDGFELDVADAARTLGLSAAKGSASPFGRSIHRCVIFGMAVARSDGWTVRRRMPAVTARHLQRLPEPVQARHDVWTRTTVRLDELERAHAARRRRWCDPATTRACSRHSSWRSASPPPPPRRPACSSSTRSHRPPEPIEGWSADEGWTPRHGGAVDPRRSASGVDDETAPDLAGEETVAGADGLTEGDLLGQRFEQLRVDVAGECVPRGQRRGPIGV